MLGWSLVKKFLMFFRKFIFDSTNSEDLYLDIRNYKNSLDQSIQI
jgi:hypothetical protein